MEGSTDADKEFEEIVNQKLVQPTKNWTSLFQNKRDITQGMQLVYFPPSRGDVLLMEEEDITPFVQIWRYYLVRCLTGNFPGLKVVVTLVSSWGVPCICRNYISVRSS
ncbi:unnamed protein product [Cuscuta epithymum]|uniref:Uncharacterized protein n=1 Tax=Cuscuta epithymum TaxID=186058 RepID=A0AAV0FQ73_9ASTE|nr:unnamed protein product [Cuscuta epithymum]